MTKSPVVLTGVKPTGMPHIGNYLGAIRPALQMALRPGAKSLFFIADYHSLTNVHDAKVLNQMIYEVAATWLACGLDPNKTIIFRQSDVPETFELSWILSCFAPKGLMNRAHAYKARVAENEAAGKEDVDHDVSMGLFTYPILMSADILLYGATHVPVGEDQVQHVEYARDIAQKFNRCYGPILTVPVHVVTEGVKIVPGLDGRKMSKSYNNHIPLFEESTKLRKLIMKIKTDSLPPEAPKDPKSSLIFELYSHFATPEEVANLEKRYLAGIGWGDAKQALFEALEGYLVARRYRERYNAYMADHRQIDEILARGKDQALAIARPFLQTIRKSIGI